MNNKQINQQKMKRKPSDDTNLEENNSKKRKIYSSTNQFLCPELCAQILLYIPHPLEVIKISTVCKSFYESISAKNCEIFWKQYCNHCFGICATNDSPTPYFSYIKSRLKLERQIMMKNALEHSIVRKECEKAKKLLDAICVAKKCEHQLYKHAASRNFIVEDFHHNDAPNNSDLDLHYLENYYFSVIVFPKKENVKMYTRLELRGYLGLDSLSRRVYGGILKADGHQIFAHHGRYGLKYLFTQTKEIGKLAEYLLGIKCEDREELKQFHKHLLLLLSLERTFRGISNIIDDWKF